MKVLHPLRACRKHLQTAYLQGLLASEVKVKVFLKKPLSLTPLPSLTSLPPSVALTSLPPSVALTPLPSLIT